MIIFLSAKSNRRMYCAYYKSKASMKRNVKQGFLGVSAPYSVEIVKHVLLSLLEPIRKGRTRACEQFLIRTGLSRVSSGDHAAVECIGRVYIAVYLHGQILTCRGTSLTRRCGAQFRRCENTHIYVRCHRIKGPCVVLLQKPRRT